MPVNPRHGPLLHHAPIGAAAGAPTGEPQMPHTAPTTLSVKGMSCGHCVKAVTEAIRQRDPQAQVQVDLPSGRVEVISPLPREQLAAAIAEEGYEVTG